MIEFPNTKTFTLSPQYKKISHMNTEATITNYSFWIKSSILLLLWLVTFYPVYPELYSTWMNDPNNSHGMLVPLISAALIWTKREEIKSTPITYAYMGAIILVLSLVIYVLAYAGQTAVISRIMIITTLIGLIIFNFGVPLFKTIAFPLCYLIFMVPVPVSIYSMVSLPLQLFATNISRFLIQAVNIPVYQEGNMLYFVQTQLEVAEACSGLRSMTAFVMLAVLFAYLMKKNWPRRIFMVASAIPLAIVANILRVTGTGILAHFYGEDIAKGFMHEFSGLVVFAFGFVIMIVLFLLLQPRDEVSKREE